MKNKDLSWKIEKLFEGWSDFSEENLMLRPGLPEGTCILYQNPQFWYIL
jgi:hypothetical protein